MILQEYKTELINYIEMIGAIKGCIKSEPENEEYKYALHIYETSINEVFNDIGKSNLTTLIKSN